MISFKQTLNDIKNDTPNLSLKNFIKYYLFNPAFRVMLNYRLGKYFYFKGGRFTSLVAQRYKYVLIAKRGCHFSYQSVIGKKLKLPHPLGIVIGDGVVIKDNVKIWHQVTLGSHGKKGQPIQYPTIEDGVKIYAGAKVIGGVSIGKNAIIGANSVVNVDVPENAVAVGIPCKILQK